MQRPSALVIITCSIFVSISCSDREKDWQQLIPENMVLMYQQENTISLSQVSELPEIALLDDITPGNVQNVQRIENRILSSSQPARLQIQSLFLYPVNATDLEAVWITSAPDNYAEYLSGLFSKAFKESRYDFRKYPVYILYLDETSIMYVIQSGDYLYLSESSLALERMIRIMDGSAGNMNPDSKPGAGELLVNTPHLYRWMQQVARVIHHPSLKKVFTGSQPLVARFENGDENSPIEQSFTAEMAINSSDASFSTQALSGDKGTISLDRHISSNSAAFGIFHIQPQLRSSNNLDAEKKLDSLLQADTELYRELAASLSDELAMVSFAESGLSNTGEYLFIRELSTPRSLRSDLNTLVRAGFISQQDDSYFIQSREMALMLGSEFCDFTDFYLSFSGEAIAIAKRKGLAESVTADRQRRRVMYYEGTYSEYREEIPEELSALIWVKSSDFLAFLQPYINPGSSINPLFAQFDVASIYTQAENNQVKVSFNSLRREESNLPYRELWVFPLGGAEITGEPIMADVAGSSREEIIFSTTSGSIYGLATDGTQVLQLSTGEDIPVGSPVVYDWYGNNREIIMQAAGNKIYAWNRTGDLLPKFPFELDAQISAPISIADVSRNGIPEIIVATEDRNVHVLDGRGINIDGWPQRTNAPVLNQPSLITVNELRSIWAVSLNGLHSWLPGGQLRPGFPFFAEAPFTTGPELLNESIFVPSADGSLFSFGLQPVFDDSLSNSTAVDSLIIQSLSIDNSPLTGFQVRPSTLLRDSTGFFRDDVFLTTTLSGSVYIHDQKGNLQFAESMGQSASDRFIPFLTDINSDRVLEIFALADLGRLYAWKYLTGEREYNIPTSAMKYPTVLDINGDNQKELIALTREGLRCWTIRSTAED